MNEPITPQAPQNSQSTPPTKKPVKFYVIIGTVLLVLILAFLYNKSQNEKKELQAQLEETEKKLEVKNDAFDALEAKQNGQSGLIADLQKQLEDFLNIEEVDPVIISTQIEERLNSIKELATKEYWYRNADRSTDKKSWIFGLDMPFSDTSLLVIYEGTIKAGINLSKIKPAIDEENRTITILLPKAEIFSHELPPETIEVLEVKNNLFNEVSFDNYNEFISEGKKAMEQLAKDKGLLTDATNEAKAIIRDSLNLMPGMDTYELIIK